MIRKCVVPFLLVLPFIVDADPVFSSSQLGTPEHEAESLGMFSSFAHSFGKRYASKDEFRRRFSIFKHNLAEINRLNREYKGSAKFELNKFADLTDEEFRRRYTPQITREEMERHTEAIKDEFEGEIVFTDELDDKDELDGEAVDGAQEENFRVVEGKVYLPKRIDYRKKKVVTPVKDQGNCGSCWAFSTIANIEGIHAKKTKKLYNLSEQELLDCDTVNKGCRGGWMHRAVKELIRLGGVANSTEYPYTAKQEACKFTKALAAVTVTDNKALAKDEKEIAKELVKTGPISIAIHATTSFKFYSSGIYDPNSADCDRSGNVVNHAVTLVGYGVQKNKQFWIVKNSWGPDWGDKGYIKMARGRNVCNIKNYASTAVL